MHQDDRWSRFAWGILSGEFFRLLVTDTGSLKLNPALVAASQLSKASAIEPNGIEEYLCGVRG